MCSAPPPHALHLAPTRFRTSFTGSSALWVPPIFVGADVMLILYTTSLIDRTAHLAEVGGRTHPQTPGRTSSVLSRQGLHALTHPLFFSCQGLFTRRAIHSLRGLGATREPLDSGFARSRSVIFILFTCNMHPLFFSCQGLHTTLSHPFFSSFESDPRTSLDSDIYLIYV